MSFIQHPLEKLEKIIKKRA